MGAIEDGYLRACVQMLLDDAPKLDGQRPTVEIHDLGATCLVFVVKRRSFHGSDGLTGRIFVNGYASMIGSLVLLLKTRAGPARSADPIASTAQAGDHHAGHALPFPRGPFHVFAPVTAGVKKGILCHTADSESNISR